MRPIAASVVARTAVLHTVSEVATTRPVQARHAETGAAAPRWGAFALVCAAYLSATVGEALLSPTFPSAAGDLDTDLALEGLAFAVLTGSIAVANLVGGALLGRIGAARLIVSAMVATAAGSAVAATAQGFGELVVSQVTMGAGAGLFFPAGLQAVGVLAGPSRKGLAMGIYGVAFSGGLTLAAVLSAIGAAHGWRLAFWASAGLALAAAVVVLAGLRVPPSTREAGGRRARLGEVLGLPTAVGSIGTICQYGAIPFLPTYAVARWGLTAGAAAGLLAVGRVLSIVAKLVSGASADRVGPRTSARRTGLVLVATGLGWVLLPGGWVTYALAAVFAGVVSSLFPIANVLALERFGGQGTAIGLYRSVQIGIGALASAVIGVVGHTVGLRPILAVAVTSPVLLLWICRDRAT
jgi:predicted MFS family arabinose efflux permease